MNQDHGGTMVRRGCRVSSKARGKQQNLLELLQGLVAKLLVLHGARGGRQCSLTPCCPSGPRHSFSSGSGQAGIHLVLAGRQGALIDGSPGLVCTNSEVKISRSSCLKGESVNTHWRFLGRLSVSSWKVVSVFPVTSRHQSEALPVFCARHSLTVCPSRRTSVQQHHKCHITRWLTKQQTTSRAGGSPPRTSPQAATHLWHGPGQHHCSHCTSRAQRIGEHTTWVGSILCVQAYGKHCDPKMSAWGQLAWGNAEGAV